MVVGIVTAEVVAALAVVVMEVMAITGGGVVGEQLVGDDASGCSAWCRRSGRGLARDWKHLVGEDILFASARLDESASMRASQADFATRHNKRMVQMSIAQAGCDSPSMLEWRHILFCSQKDSCVEHVHRL